MLAERLPVPAERLPVLAQRLTGHRSGVRGRLLRRLPLQHLAI